MYIGKVLLSEVWEKLEDLIKSQVSGQSAFAFNSDTVYQLQGEGVERVRLCDFTGTPIDLQAGFRIEGTQTAHYKPSNGYLFVRVEKTEGNGNADYGNTYLKISKMGQ